MAAKSLSKEYLAQTLAKAGLITPEQAAFVLERYAETRRRLAKARALGGENGEGQPPSAVEVITAMRLKPAMGQERILTEEAVMRAVAADVGLPFRRIDPLELNLDVVTRDLPRSFALKHLVVPLGMAEGALEVAVFDPFDQAVLEDVRRVSKGPVRPVMATKADIKKLISEFYGFQASIAGAQGQFGRPQVDLGNLEQYVRLRSTDEIQATDQHIKNAVDYIIGHAFEQTASDIHIEPRREECLVRLRIDGVLHEAHHLPKNIHAAIISRVKTLSRLDIAEKRRPQDGRIKIGRGEHEAEIRVSTIPVAFGEKAVLRVLNPQILLQDLATVGFPPQELARYLDFAGRTNGVILVTGPTGSGKSTTLYSTLRRVGTPDKNIITIEDPIEMILENFSQIAVNPQVGITFGNVLRNVLRQDPDVIMIGEMRDRDTAVSAIQAALTGHLVLSTLHTNDAPSAITRLIDLGVEPFLLSSALVGVTGQRLLRKICPYCEQEFVMPAAHARRLGLAPPEKGGLRLKKGAGCEHCRGTGYLGRTPAMEVMAVSERIKSLVLERSDASQIKKAARAEGMRTLRENAVRLMLEGVTTFEEAFKTTPGDG